MAQIIIDNLSKNLDAVFTLDRISMEIQDQELIVVLGPSGCGKSTLLNIISGLLMPDSGAVCIDGENWTGRTGRAGYMQQKDLLLPSKNILDNICIPLILKGMDKASARSEVKKYLSDFGLAGFEGYYPRQLSGGMRQRAALLRTYLFSREILLLDEPFASLDAINRRKMQVWLKALHNHYRSTILFVTHDLEEAMLLADRIYLFSARPASILLQASRPAGLEEESRLKEQILAILEKEA